MEKTTILVAILLSALLCTILLGGCGKLLDKSETLATEPTASATDSADSNKQPGAIERQYNDKEGNKITEYKNPDGSGGGSVELD